MDDPSLGQTLTLGDLVPKSALEEMCRTFIDLFGAKLEVHDNSWRGGEEAPPGARIRTAPIEFEGDVLGTVSLGPYIPANTMPGIRSAGPEARLTRMRDSTAERVMAHVLAVLDVLLWSGHRSYLASQLQLASSRESHRELTAKNIALRESLERAQESDRLKSNFLATISHELRTPLTSILGYTEMLLEGLAGTLSAEQAEWVVTIQKKGQHLLSLISTILDLSKLDSETGRPDVTEVDVGALCRDVVVEALPQAKTAGIDLRLAVQPDVRRVHTDLACARKIIANLVDNALKFTPPGGTVDVDVQMGTPSAASVDPVGLALLEPASQIVEIRISDTGIGIAEEHLDRVFDAFYQVDNSSTRSYGGTGLGLSVVKRLVESLRGRVWATSTVGEGSIFRVELPVDRRAP